jgi:hypothetical protein
MNIITIKKDGQELNFLNRYPNEVNSKGQFEYFISGQGYKKTKKFKLSDVELPELKTLSWYEISKIYDQYGYYIALEYAEQKTAGCIAGRYANAYYQLYKRAESILTELPDCITFFESLPIDYMLSLIGYASIDIIKYDRQLSIADPLYNDNECTYNGLECSQNQYIAIKYSQSHADAISLMLEHNES